MDCCQIAIVFVVFAAAIGGGCLCDPDYCRMPNLLHPGHISEQQDRMKQFDPFARSDIGPKIEGDRPHGADRATDTPKHLDEYKTRR